MSHLIDISVNLVNNGKTTRIHQGWAADCESEKAARKEAKAVKSFARIAYGQYLKAQLDLSDAPYEMVPSELNCKRDGEVGVIDFDDGGQLRWTVNVR